MMVDANSFKQINTRFGHLTGDSVLAEIAWLLKSSIRASNAVVRYGGDEVLIWLADRNAADAQNVIDRIRGKLDDWNAAKHLEGFRVTVSGGAANGTKATLWMKCSMEPIARCLSKRARRSVNNHHSIFISDRPCLGRSNFTVALSPSA